MITIQEIGSSEVINVSFSEIGLQGFKGDQGIDGLIGQTGIQGIQGIQGLSEATFLGSITPSSTPTGTGKAFWLATQNGTYTNFGGKVVNANSFAVISRDAGGVFSISQTALDLTSYVKTETLSNYSTKTYTDTFSGEILANKLAIEGLSSGYKGVLYVSTVPSSDGLYLAGESGTYTNAGNLIVDLTIGVTYINISNTKTVFSKTVIPIDSLPDSFIKTWGFKNALNNVRNGTGNASLMVFGDSIARSLIAEDALRNMYKTYGFRGIFCSFISAFGGPLYSINRNGLNSGATVLINQYNEYFNGDVFQLADTGQQVSFNFKNVVDEKNRIDFSTNRATIVYKTVSGGGTFDVYKSIGAGTNIRTLIGTVNTNGASGLATTVFDFSKSLESTIEIECVWASGTVVIVGALMEDTTKKGLILSFADKGGLDMVNINTMPSANVSVLLNLIKPNCITWSMKDSNAVSKLTALNTLFKSVYSLTEFLIIVPYPDIIAATEAQAKTANYPIRDWAIANKQDYYDTLKDVPSYQYGLDRGWFADVTHLNETAQNVLSVNLFKEWAISPAYKGVVFDYTDRKKTYYADDDIILQQKSLSKSLVTLGDGTYKDTGVVIGQGDSFVYNQIAFTPIANSDFMLLTTFKIPIGQTFRSIGIVGIRTFAGGISNGSLSIGLNATSTRLEVVLRTVSGVSQRHDSTDAYNYILANQGGINEMIFIKNDADAIFIKLFINGIYFELNALQLNAVTSLDTGFIKLGAQAGDQTNTNLVIFNCGYKLGSFTKIDVDQLLRYKNTSSFTLYNDFNENRGEISATSKNEKFYIKGNSYWENKKYTDIFQTKTTNVNIQMVSNQTYIHDWIINGNIGNFTLPISANVGDFIKIIGYGYAKWRVKQNAFEQILTGVGATVGTNATTIGITGQIATTNIYDCVTLRCAYKDTGVKIVWVVENFTGTLIFT